MPPFPGHLYFTFPIRFHIAISLSLLFDGFVTYLHFRFLFFFYLYTEFHTIVLAHVEHSFAFLSLQN